MLWLVHACPFQRRLTFQARRTVDDTTAIDFSREASPYWYAAFNALKMPVCCCTTTYGREQRNAVDQTYGKWSD